MFTLNRMTIYGSLGQDPDIRTMNSGSRVASFPVATNDSYKDPKTGEYIKTTEWHKVVIFNETLIKQIDGALKKRSTVYVEGKLQTRSYFDRNHSDIKHYITEIVVSGNNGKVLFDRPSQGHENSDNGLPDQYGNPGTQEYHDH